MQRTNMKLILILTLLVVTVQSQGDQGVDNLTQETTQESSTENPEMISVSQSSEDPPTPNPTFPTSLPPTPYPLLRNPNYFVRTQSMVGYIPIYVQQNLNEPHPDTWNPGDVVTNLAETISNLRTGLDLLERQILISRAFSTNGVQARSNLQGLVLVAPRH